MSEWIHVEGQPCLVPGHEADKYHMVVQWPSDQCVLHIFPFWETTLASVTVFWCTEKCPMAMYHM